MKLSPKEILKKYARTTLFPDLLIVPWCDQGFQPQLVWFWHERVIYTGSLQHLQQMRIAGSKGWFRKGIKRHEANRYTVQSIIYIYILIIRITYNNLYEIVNKHLYLHVYIQCVRTYLCMYVFMYICMYIYMDGIDTCTWKEWVFCLEYSWTMSHGSDTHLHLLRLGCRPQGVEGA